MEYLKKNKLVVQMIIAALLMVFILVLVFCVHISKSMTQSEIQELMKKVDNYTNYSFIWVDRDKEQEILVKKPIAVKRDTQKYVWSNYETGEKITINYQNNTAVIEQLEKIELDTFGLDNYSQYKFKYLGESKDGNSVIAEYKSDKNYIDLTINKETGFITKREIYALKENMKKGELQTIQLITNVILNSVVDEDIERPDITKYRIITNKDI